VRWVRAALGDKNQITVKLIIADDECHGVYTTAARTLYHPLITVKGVVFEISKRYAKSSSN